MPALRVLRVFRPLAPSLAFSGLALAFAVTQGGCKPHAHAKDKESPAPSAAPSAANDPEDFTPLHPGHVNQRDPKGGFLAARHAPPPSKTNPLKPTIFDSVPDEIKLQPLKAENGHCGEFDVAGSKVVLDCLTDDYGKIAGAAHPVASDEDLKNLRTKRKLPAVVDHRKDNTEGPIMDQGRSASCTAFSLTAAVEHAAAHFLSEPPALSPMHVWARYHSPSMQLAESDNVNKGLADSKTFPFDQKLANEWMKSERRVDQRQLHHADQSALFDITNVTRLDHGNMQEIKSALAAGQDIWFAIKAAHGMMHPKKNSDGESMIPDFDWHKLADFKGGHAILLSGYEDTPKGTFYLIHNSWGPKWGTEGYAWIWEKTLKTNISDAFVLQVRPTELAHTTGAHLAEHKFSNCRSGLAPDAITTQCVPPCADGGPRVNGVCPTPDQCPDGEVNLDGKCELSAPPLNKTLSDGTKVSCGLSGCVYVVPNGQESCSQAQGCTIACAAPRFMLGSGPRGLACNG